MFLKKLRLKPEDKNLTDHLSSFVGNCIHEDIKKPKFEALMSSFSYDKRFELIESSLKLDLSITYALKRIYEICNLE